MGKRPSIRAGRIRPLRKSPARSAASTRYYPLLADLQNQEVLVVGGGAVAERKVKSLVSSGAVIRIVSPDLTPGLKRMVRGGRLRYRAGRYRPLDLGKAALVYAATDDPVVNAAVASEARMAGRWVNAADAPRLSSFLVPAAFRKGDLIIAISTRGISPALARRIRKEMEKFFGRHFEAYLRLLGKGRQLILKKIPDERARKRLFERMVTSEMLDGVRAGRIDRVKKKLRSLLEGEGIEL